MILRNAFQTGTRFSSESEASRALNQLTLRYRREEFYTVEVEYEESEVEQAAREAQYSLSLENREREAADRREANSKDQKTELDI